MSNLLYSSNAVDSLIAYINDVKPYHSKLSEIIEEYQFYETVNVSVTDAKHFTKTKISCIWETETLSNGLYPPIIEMPFVKQSKGSRYWNNSYAIDVAKPDTQIAGLNSAYYLKHNIGLKHVIRNGRFQYEGLDYHVSHGAHSINVDGTARRYVE